jgi:hypothetical protein
VRDDDRGAHDAFSFVGGFGRSVMATVHRDRAGGRSARPRRSQMVSFKVSRAEPS